MKSLQGIDFLIFAEIIFVMVKSSVPETGFYGTEYACRAQNSLLWYAKHFLEHSV